MADNQPKTLKRYEQWELDLLTEHLDDPQPTQETLEGLATRLNRTVIAIKNKLSEMRQQLREQIPALGNVPTPGLRSVTIRNHKAIEVNGNTVTVYY